MLSLYDDEVGYRYDPDRIRPSELLRIRNNKEIGRFFLDYAYSTPAGIAYRLAYGVPKP